MTEENRPERYPIEHFGHAAPGAARSAQRDTSIAQIEDAPARFPGGSGGFSERNSIPRPPAAGQCGRSCITCPTVT